MDDPATGSITASAPIAPATTAPHRRESDTTSLSSEGYSGAAQHLLERRTALDVALRPREESELMSVLRRTPPAPIALVHIEVGTTRERFIKVLKGAKIEVEEASTAQDALHRLATRTHAVLFTDRVDLVYQSRQLPSGAATHVVFINSAGEPGYHEGLRAGASDCMTSEARGEQFWAHLMLVRRITDFAASLQLAVTDNHILSTLDELTRAGSRRFFEHQFPREVACATRLGTPLALVMCDIDHFKRINDRFGHQAGDEVLREFARRLSSDLRSSDWLARTGGEEFAVVLPETREAGARVIAERLLRDVNSNAFVTAEGPLQVTASFGVCALERLPRNERLADAMITAADRALYESKHRGRNQVTSAAAEDIGARLQAQSAD